MADDAKSSQKLLSPIGDPRMTKLETFERVVIHHESQVGFFLQKSSHLLKLGNRPGGGGGGGA